MPHPDIPAGPGQQAATAFRQHAVPTQTRGMSVAHLRETAEMRHPAAVTEARGADGDPASAAALLGRGPEHRMAASILAALLSVGVVMGTVNLFVGNTVHEGHRWIYVGATLLSAVAAVTLALRRRATGAQTFALVLLGDAVYVVVAMCVENPSRHATPLMLLFPSFFAAWFLRRWQFAVNLVLTPLACLLGMWTPLETPVGMAVDVALNAGMLNVAALGVYLLRNRVQRLLEATQALSSVDPLTGLHNRRYLVEQAPRVWRQARRDGTGVAPPPRPPTPAAPGPSGPRACGARPAATGRGWPRWCSTSTTSSGSTTPTGTPPATRCCARWPVRCPRRSARPTSWLAPAGRSWSCCAWSATPVRPAGWPSACAPRSPAAAPTAGTGCPPRSAAR